MGINLVLFNALNSLAFRYGLLDNAFIFIAKYLPYILILSIFAFLLKDFKKYKFLPILSLFSAFFSHYVVTEGIRYFSYNARPFIEKGIAPLFDHADTSSFPSGHASFFFALSTIIYFYNKKAGYIFFALSFLMGTSRIISGIHWPLDILVGGLIGFLVGLGVWKISVKKGIVS